MDYHLLLLASFVLLSFTTQAMSGFGSIIIAITLGAHFYPIEFLLPILVPLDMLLNIYIVIKHRQHIRFDILLKHIIPYMGIGLALGLLTFNYLTGPVLKIIFGVLIILISARELLVMLRGLGTPAPLHPAVTRVCLAFSGVIQGVYASGGPMLVYVVSRLRLSKSVFRSTLSALWILMNAILIISYTATGKITAATFEHQGMLFPLIVVGIILGEKLHRFINEKLFKLVVYSILLLAGIAILIR